MKLDVMMTYKRQLDLLAPFEKDFKYVEAHSSTVGATNITMLETLAESIVSHVKDAVTFVKDPFEPAVLDNLVKSGYDVGSTLDVIEQTPSDLDFDARDILQLEKLNTLVETIFRCIVAIKSCQGLSMPRALIDLDLIVHDILASAVATFTNPLDPDFHSMTGKMTMNAEPIITFTRLNEQKYFTDAEKQEIQDAENAKIKAIREAEERAFTDEKASKIMKLIRDNLGDKITYLDGIPADTLFLIEHGYRFWTAGKYGVQFDSEMVSDGEIAVRELVYFAKLLDSVYADGKNRSFRLQSSYTILDDETDATHIPEGEIISLIVD